MASWVNPKDDLRDMFYKVNDNVQKIGKFQWIKCVQVWKLLVQCPLVAKYRRLWLTWHALSHPSSILEAACVVFNFRSFKDLRTRWEMTTGGASRISSLCHWRNGWRFMGCNSTVPKYSGQSPIFTVKREKYSPFIPIVMHNKYFLMGSYFFSAQVFHCGRKR